MPGRSIRLKTRIAVGFTVLLALLAGLGGLSVAFVDRAATSAADLRWHAFTRAQALGEIRNRVLEIKSILAIRLANPDDPVNADWRGEIARHRRIIDESLALAAAQPGDAQSMAAIQTDWSDLKIRVDIEIATIEDGATAQMAHAFLRDDSWVFAQTVARIADAIILAGGQANETAGSVETLRRDLHGTVIAILGSGLALALALGISLAVQITRPLARQRDALLRLADGEDDVAIPDTSRGDELGEMARALDVLRREVQDKRRTELKFATIFKATPDVVTITERETGRYLDVNAGFESFIGFTRAEVVGRTALELNIWATPQHRADLIAALQRQGRLVNFESRVRRRDGQLFEALISAEQFQVDKVDCLIMVARDVTERRRHEDLLRQSLTELERSNIELERFAHVAAHDLQEPCRTICSFAQLLQRSDGPTLSTDGRDYLTFLVNGATRMRDQINGLLTYSRVAAAVTPFAPVDLGEVIGAVVEDLGAAIAARQAKIDIGPLPTVLGDISQMRQLFANIVGNGLKFQAPDTHPLLRIRARQSEGMWEVVVADNGIGIDPAYHTEVFEAFRRLHGPEHYPGSGLGLAIAKRIVERHGGRIWLSPTPGGGTMVHCLLRGTIANSNAAMTPEEDNRAARD